MSAAWREYGCCSQLLLQDSLVTTLTRCLGSANHRLSSNIISTTDDLKKQGYAGFRGNNTYARQLSKLISPYQIVDMYITPVMDYRLDIKKRNVNKM